MTGNDIPPPPVATAIDLEESSIEVSYWLKLKKRLLAFWSWNKSWALKGAKIRLDKNYKPKINQIFQAENTPVEEAPIQTVAKSPKVEKYYVLKARQALNRTRGLTAGLSSQII